MTSNYKYLRKWFTNWNERNFYKILNEFLDSKYVIIPQVHLDDLIKPTLTGKNRKFSFWHINQKSVDFVICYKASLFPILAIELDGPEHGTNSKIIAKDREVERMLTEAGIKLKRFNNSDISNPIKIKMEVESLIQNYHQLKTTFAK